MKHPLPIPSNSHSPDPENRDVAKRLQEAREALWAAEKHVGCEHVHVADPVDLPAAEGRLDPSTKNVEEHPQDTPEQDFRFSLHAIERNQWLAAMRVLDPQGPRLRRFILCGSDAWVYEDPETGRYSVRASTCNLRFCPVCRLRKQLELHDTIYNHLMTHSREPWQFWTLTMKHCEAPLKMQCDHLRHAFRKLRQRSLFKKAVAGGYAVIEITRNTVLNQWHPHMHVLVQTSHCDWAKLRKAWCCVTLGSNVIDCQKVKTLDKSAAYMSKYCGKPPQNLDLTNLDLCRDYYEAIYHGRFAISFGNCHALPDDDAPEPPVKPTLIKVGALSDIIRKSREKDPIAIAILKSLGRVAEDHSNFLENMTNGFKPTNYETTSPGRAASRTPG